MKPLKTERQNTDALLELGLASVQIVHDLKNQVNGLKLYATFLRKRFETQERPADERETIAKIIAGLERAAADMTTLVRFGRPLDLHPQPHVDLAQLLREATIKDQLVTDVAEQTFEGAFDAEKMREALQAMSGNAWAHASADESQHVSLRPDEDENGGTYAVIEWRGLKYQPDAQPFHSFAGSDALRMALAGKIIRAHGGSVAHDAHTLRARLPLESSDE